MTITQLFKTAPVTTILLASFIGLFIFQLLTGIDANNPTSEQLLHWGANALPFTMRDEPWRLITSGFLHIGLMHLLFNGFAMYFFGQIAEPMFGSVKFLLLFLLAVIGGNLLNNQVTWQSILDGTGQWGLSAGASGGIMGIGAALLIAAFFKMSVNGMILNLKSLIFIMGINLVYGFAVPGIDNAGHIGGAITGLFIALPIAIAYRQHLAAQQLAAANYQSAYQSVHQNTYQTTFANEPLTADQNHYQDGYQRDLQGDSNNNPPLTNIFADNNSQIPVNLDPNASSNDSIEVINNRLPIDSNNEINYSSPAYVAPKAAMAEPVKLNLIWQLLPWIIMLIIVIGFVWWWQDIHNQILQILAASE